MGKYFTSFEQIKFHAQNKALGEGQNSNVYLVSHKDFPQTFFAMKEISLQQNDIQFVQEEICFHSRLKHPHIIEFLDHLQTEDKIYIFLEFAEQGDLFHYCRERELTDSQIRTIFRDLCQALAYLHSMNIIHRDIKPENILINASGQAKLCDFGWTCLESG